MVREMLTEGNNDMLSSHMTLSKTKAPVLVSMYKLEHCVREWELP